MNKIFKFIFITLFFSTVYLKADTFSIYAENDFFFDKDYYYTHATRFSYQNNNYWEYIFAQNMYTPKEKDTLCPVEGDRPYAGWLYGGIAKKLYNDNFEHYFELDLGVVGPSSRAYETQKAVHEFIHDDVPCGWDSQIGDEFAYILSGKESYNINLVDKYFCTIPNCEWAIGNVQSYIGIGGTIMAGYNVEQSSHSLIPIKEIQDDKRIYSFIGVSERKIFNNIFLDDNDYNGYPYSVERENCVFDVYFGICLQYKFIKVYWTRDYRSKEFETQTEEFKPYDSIKISFIF